jgi:hypothetical protein
MQLNPGITEPVLSASRNGFFYSGLAHLTGRGDLIQLAAPAVTATPLKRSRRMNRHDHLKALLALDAGFTLLALGQAPSASTPQVLIDALDDTPIDTVWLG